MTTVAHPTPAPLAAVAHDAGFVSEENSWTDGVLDPALSSASHPQRIIAAAGAVESLEWELDRAKHALVTAIEQAADNGCGTDLIARSAGLSKEEVATMLWAARSGAAASRTHSESGSTA